MPAADRRVAIRLVLGVALALLGGAAVLSTHRSPPSRRPGSPPYLTVFLIDGLSQSLFEREIAAGHLPAMRRLLEEGLYVRDGIGAFPSMTGYAFYPLLTGKDAAGSGVLGLRWFDTSRTTGNFRHYVGRTSRAMNGDFHAAPATLFECFSREHSYAINSYATRGVDHAESAEWAFVLAKYREHHWGPRLLAMLPYLGPVLVPTFARAESTVVRRAVADLARGPKIQWITLSSLDTQNHLDGSGTTNAPLLEVLDGLIAMYRGESAALGTERDRVYLLASDHGVVAVSHNVDLRPPLARLGLQTWRGPATYFREAALEAATGAWSNEDVVLAINGNTMAYVYLLNARARARRADVAAALQATTGVELVVWRDESGSVTVTGSTGRSRISQGDSGLAYSVVEGRDPLGFCGGDRPAGLCDGRPRSADSWLAATHRLAYPYAVPRLQALLSQPAVGDFVVTTAPGFDLAPDYELVVGNYRGGHGGLRADQLRVPYVLSGPGVAPGRLETARAEDVGAMLTGLFGCPEAGVSAPSPADRSVPRTSPPRP